MFVTKNVDGEPDFTKNVNTLLNGGNLRSSKDDNFI